jgi:ribonuclease P protein component
VKRKFRLTKSADFKRVRRSGKSYAHPLIVLIAAANGLEYSRITVSASRTVGNAIKRNRAKRILRAASQPLIEVAHPGWDIILLARQPVINATFQETSQALLGLFTQANLLTNSHED